MYIDKELQFADGTWAPTATGDNISPNVLDTGPLGGIPNVNTGRQIGIGEGLVVVITVKTSVVSAGGGTVDFRLRTDSAVSLLSSPVDLASTTAQSVANLTAGKQFYLRIPPVSTMKRYLGIDAFIGVAVLTAGAFEAEIIKDPQINVKFAGGFGIDV